MLAPLPSGARARGARGRPKPELSPKTATASMQSRQSLPRSTLATRRQRRTRKAATIAEWVRRFVNPPLRRAGEPLRATAAAKRVYFSSEHCKLQCRRAVSRAWPPSAHRAKSPCAARRTPHVHSHGTATLAHSRAGLPRRSGNLHGGNRCWTAEATTATRQSGLTAPRRHGDEARLPDRLRTHRLRRHPPGHLLLPTLPTTPLASRSSTV